jgi:hypothetical protein
MTIARSHTLSANPPETEEPITLVGTFFLAPGRCFRMTKAKTSQKSHCDQPVVWKGRWRDVTGEVWTVEACAQHEPTAQMSDE